MYVYLKDQKNRILANYVNSNRCRKTQRKQKVLGDNGYVNYLDYGDSFIGVCTYPNKKILYIKYAQLFYQLYPNKLSNFSVTVNLDSDSQRDNENTL